MKIEILDEARLDLTTGFDFYERQSAGLGAYFLDSLFSDIDSLQEFAGVHNLVHGYHRSLAKRFPFAIYYTANDDLVRVYAILDCRRNPSWARERLRSPSS